MGKYVAVKFDEETLDAIEAIQRQLNLYNPVPRDKLHSTISYSREDFPFIVNEAPANIGTSSSLDVFESDNGKRALVLLLDSTYLIDRHNMAMEMGATYDYPDYIPHVTLSYDIGYINYESSELPIIDLNISGEYEEPLNLNWVAEEGS